MSWDTSTQLGSITSAFDVWTDVITAAPTRDIRVSFIWVDDDSFLAAAGGNYAATSSASPVWQNSLEVIWKNGGICDVGSAYDIYIMASAPEFGSFNFSDMLDPDKYDFQTIMTHEVGHAMGFISACDNDPPENWDEGYYTAWDLLMKNDQGLSPNEPGFEYAPGDIYTVGSDGLVVYNPDPSEGGSSMSHIDEDSDPNALMRPTINPGERYGLSAKEVSLLREMGWSVIPEPSSSLLLVSAFGLSLFRRRKQAA